MPRKPNPFFLSMLRTFARALTVLHRQIGLVREWLQAKAAGLAAFQPRPDDVYIATYPKSGTTLMQMIAHQLVTGAEEPDFPHVESFSPWFEFVLARGNPAVLEDVPSPRFLKTHDYRRRLPAGRYIYILRDPADVGVSAFHHWNMIMGTEGDLVRFVDWYLSDRMIFGSWFRHLAAWWPHRHDEDVLFLRYEEVIQDVEGTIRRVAEFCGLPLDESKLPRMVERCGIESMRRLNDKFDPRLRRVSRTPQQKFIRAGGAGGGEAAFNDRQKAKLAEKLAKVARRLGCSPEELRGRREAREGGAPSRVA
jgi:hypothetical protein